MSSCYLSRPRNECLNENNTDGKSKVMTVPAILWSIFFIKVRQENIILAETQLKRCDCFVEKNHLNHELISIKRKKVRRKNSIIKISSLTYNRKQSFWFKFPTTIIKLVQQKFCFADLLPYICVVESIRLKDKYECFGKTCFFDWAFANFVPSRSAGQPRQFPCQRPLADRPVFGRVLAVWALIAVDWCLIISINKQNLSGLLKFWKYKKTEKNLQRVSEPNRVNDISIKKNGKTIKLQVFMKFWSYLGIKEFDLSCVDSKLKGLPSFNACTTF